MSKKPVPKKQQSKSSSRSRNSKYVYIQRQKLGSIQLTNCSNCGEKRRTHYACGECGFYRGRQVLDIKAKKTTDVEEITA